MADQLTKYRRDIDQVDRQLLSLLAKRLELVRSVGEFKRQRGLPVRVPEREAALVEAALKNSPLPPELVREFYHLLFKYAYAIESDTKK